MALKSMKVTKADRKEREKGYAIAPGGGEDYPYGLRISLDADSMKKLGITSLPKAGKTVKVVAECCVKSTSVDDRDGRTERRMELQIEKMDVDIEDESAEEAIGRAIDEADED